MVVPPTRSFSSRKIARLVPLGAANVRRRRHDDQRWWTAVIQPSFSRLLTLPEPRPRVTAECSEPDTNRHSCPSARVARLSTSSEYWRSAQEGIRNEPITQYDG